MKIMVCGKGGTGKSSIAALMGIELARRGYEVVVVDADESNMTLPMFLGMEPPRPLVEYLGGKKRVADAMFRRSELDLVSAISRGRRN